MISLTQHIEKWQDCQACPLAQQRFRICLGKGSIPCDVLFVGEAPGTSEDALGQPFVGPAGQLLDQIIERALECWIAPGPDHTEIRVAFTNLVCCFPREAKERGENEPEYDEIMACRSRLIEFVNVTQPGLIVCVGKLAEEYTPVRLSMQYLHIIHPAALLKPGIPLVKKQQEMQRSIVVIRGAVNVLLKQPRKPFVQWEDERAKVKSRREKIKETYQRADPDTPPW